MAGERNPADSIKAARTYNLSAQFVWLEKFNYFLSPFRFHRFSAAIAGHEAAC
jgi:hypothetical protein